jgi:hypothetical protein
MTGVRFPVMAIVSSLSPRTKPLFRLTYLEYEAHPPSKFPWGRVQKQNTIA